MIITNYACIMDISKTNDRFNPQIRCTYVCMERFMFAQTTLQPRLSRRRNESVSLCFGEHDRFQLHTELSQ